MAPSALDFTAIDFETANRERASVCAVGVVRVLGGQIIAKDSWLVVPPTGADAFDLGNIRIHGIRPQDVRRRGISWEESLARIESFRSGSLLIAHNSSFDQSVYAESCRRVGITPPSARWEDTLKLARQHLRLPDYKLPTVAKHLRVKGFKHHDAAADAAACAQIAISIGNQIGAESINGLWPLQQKRTGSSTWSSDRVSQAKVADLPKPGPEADERHPLFGQSVVLTGDLDSMDRWTAFERIAAAGGTPQKNVTLKTTMLVVASRGHLPDTYRPDLGSGKEQKAADYRARGNTINFVGRNEFLELLEWRSAEIPLGESGQPADVDIPDNAAPITRQSVPEPASAVSAPEAPEHRAPAPLPPDSPIFGRAREEGGTPTQTPEVPQPRDRQEPPRPFGEQVAPSGPQWAPAHLDPHGQALHQPQSRSSPVEWSGASQGGSIPRPALGRKVLGWVLLVPSVLALPIVLLVALVGTFTPAESVGVKIAAILMLLVVALVLLGVAFLGVYLIWLRGRRRPQGA